MQLQNFQISYSIDFNNPLRKAIYLQISLNEMPDDYHERVGYTYHLISNSWTGILKNNNSNDINFFYGSYIYSFM